MDELVTIPRCSGAVSGSELPHGLQVDPIGLGAGAGAADEGAGEEVRIAGSQPQAVGVSVVQGQVDFVAQPPAGIAGRIPALRAAVAVVPGVAGLIQFGIVPVQKLATAAPKDQTL